MHRAILLVFLSFFCLKATALKGVGIGARVGQVGLLPTLRGRHGNAVGFGVDVALQPHSFIEVALLFSQSRHSRDPTSILKLTSFAFCGDVKLVQSPSFDFFLGMGPALYFFNVSGASDTRFGIVGGFGADYYLIKNRLRVGAEVRWQGVFSQTADDNYWTAMARLGYVFKVKGKKKNARSKKRNGRNPARVQGKTRR